MSENFRQENLADIGQLGLWSAVHFPIQGKIEPISGTCPRLSLSDPVQAQVSKEPLPASAQSLARNRVQNRHRMPGLFPCRAL
ncbi:MAG: hypothetical protein U5R49_25335 [Deltaproteobacteria bacterium]|nr:hypothetical protein [Deltaproteobacteria bacterium]